MTPTEMSVRTADGECAATLHTPDDTGSWPAVIMYPDAGGVRETFRVMADRLAAAGYAVLLPDVYHRSGGFAPFDIATVFSVPAERERLMALAASLTPEMVVADAGAFLDALAARPEVAGTAVGTTGYCMGGRNSLIVAGSRPDRVAAAASFHGGRLAAADDPASPHLLADRIRGVVLVAAARDDDSFPAEQHARLEESFREAGVRYTLETYPAAHGFAVPDNPTHDAAAEERHWAAMDELFGAALR